MLHSTDWMSPALRSPPLRGCVCVFCWDDSWFSLVFRYQPVDIIQPTNHVLPASFGDSDWHIVTGNSLTSTNESPRRKPSQHELEKQRLPGDYFFFLLLVNWLGAVPFFLCPSFLPSPLCWFPRSPFLQSMTSWGRNWTTASWFRVRSAAGGLCRSWGQSFTNTSTCTSTNTPTSTPSRPSPVCPRRPSTPRPTHPPWCVPRPEMWG